MATFTGTNGDDSLPPVGQSNIGDDIFHGLGGADQIQAGAGHDIAYGGSGVDFIDGGGGDDYLDGGTGADFLIGNFGDDTYVVDSAGDSITEYSASDGTDTIYSSVSYTLPQFVERLILTGSGSISATGGNSPDTLIGNAGANALTGNGGADLLSGGDGGDVLRGGLGPDILDGGNGSDTATYTESGAAVVVKLATGVGIGGNAQGDTYIGVENVNGSSGDDNIAGNSIANALNGWAGKDTLTGGAGADRFVFSSAAHTASGAAGRDSIADFSHAQGDRIDLAAIDADNGLAGNQAFTFIAGAAFTGTAGQLHYLVAGAHLIVEGDTNGDGAADLQIIVNNTASLVAGDFAL